MPRPGPAHAGLRRSCRRLVAAAVAACAATASVAPPAAEAAHEGADLVRAVKATFLYKFAPFVTWPATAFPTPVSPFRICVLGDAELAALARRGAAGQRVGERPLAVETDPPPGTACQILYLGVGSPAPETWLEAARGRPVLTVTDEASGEEGRGIIHFVLRQERVRFEIDQRLALEGRLEISSSVLALALRVER